MSFFRREEKALERIMRWNILLQCDCSECAWETASFSCQNQGWYTKY